MCVFLIRSLSNQFIFKKLIMIKIIIKLKQINSIRCLSSSSIKLNNNSNDNQNNFSNYKTNLRKNLGDDLVKKIYSNQPVEGEPIAPAKNRYINTKNPALNAFRPENFDESKASFFMFPGQGSQFVGMGKKLIKNDVAKDLFERANKILDYNLEYICLNGPEETLNQTIYAQPAIFVTSLAAIEKFKLEYPGLVENCIGAAGNSLGELTALVFSGALTFEDGLRLVKVRAEDMQKACEQTTSGLMTIIYGRDAKIELACKAAKDYCLAKDIDPAHAVCSISSYLFPHCKVLGGHIEALNFIQNNAKDFGIKRCKRLPVSGAFHTSLMYSAAGRFKAILHRLPIEMPTKIPVYCNLDGLPYLTKEELLYKLPKQIHKPVKWEQTMFITFTREKHEPHPWIFECGPNTSLLTILKNINARAYLKAKHIEV